jgi:hypothetical protein
MKKYSNRPRWALALAAATVMLAACGGGRDDDRPPQARDPLTGPPTEAGASGANFVAYLRTLVAIRSETAEPFAVDSFTPPRADNSEPEPVF